MWWTTCLRTSTSSRRFSSPRYEVIAASCGPDALEHTGAIDLVLLDVVMPGMDGYAVCRHVRESCGTFVHLGSWPCAYLAA